MTPSDLAAIRRRFEDRRARWDWGAGEWINAAEALLAHVEALERWGAGLEKSYLVVDRRSIVFLHAYRALRSEAELAGDAACGAMLAAGQDLGVAINRVDALEWALSEVKAARNALSAHVEALETENARLREGLEKIIAWEMPSAGYVHDNGTLMSYEFVYGADGVREHIRALARAALAAKEDL